MTSPLKKISSTGAIKVGVEEKLSLDGTAYSSPKREQTRKTTCKFLKDELLFSLIYLA